MCKIEVTRFEVEDEKRKEGGFALVYIPNACLPLHRATFMILRCHFCPDALSMPRS